MEITYYFKSKDKDSRIVAEFGVKIPEWDLYFSKMKLIRTLNGNLFIAAPSFKGKDKDGKEVYKDYWWFGKDTGARFKEKVLILVQDYIKEKFGEQSLADQMVPYTEDLF